MRAYAHYNPFNIRKAAEYPDWQKVFNNKNQIDLEIGFSNGDWLIAYAEKFPERNIIGVETRTKFIEYVRQRISEAGLKNAYVLKANINTAFTKLFKDIKLTKVYVLFPDPWYKKGHIKRRVVLPEFIDLLSRNMKENGELHIATDKEFLAHEMLAVFEGDEEYPGFKDVYINKAGAEKFAEHNIKGITTPIERYNLNKGNKIYRMVFNRSAVQTMS